MTDRKGERLHVLLTGQAGIRSPAAGKLIDAGRVGRLGRLAFAYLVVSRHRPVPREELAEVLWGDDLPRTWDTSLRVVISRLRTWLEAAGLERSRCLTSAFGCYQLNLPETAVVDVEEAEARLAVARAALAAGDAGAARREAAAVAATARQEFLAGASGPWVERQQAAWRVLRVNGFETLGEALLAAGDAGAALAAAEEAVNLELLREPAHVLVIRALAAAGNRAEALRAYERLRRLLEEELGVPPSTQTQAAYVELLREDLEATVPAAPEPSPPRLTLPAQLSSFVGRGHEVGEVMRQLRSTRMITLVGTGGMGKTRLALEVAGRLQPELADGATLVSLGEVPDGSGVGTKAMVDLGLAEEPGRSPARTVAAALAGRRLLLVVDNCEHVVEAAGELVATVLEACPGVIVLATSREPLRVPGEVAWRVPPLGPDDARRLFVDRAAAVSAGVGLDASDTATVDAICRRLDGIPLAIELAAARVEVLSLPDIAERLDDRFHLLTGGARTAPARHQTLRSTLDWSYDGLPDDQRDLLHELSVFAGAFTLDAARRVSGVAAAAVLDSIAGLVSRSLVLASPPAGGEVRYRLLETIRAYASEKLAESGTAAATRARLLAWAAEVVEEAETHLDGPGQVECLDRLDAEHANLLGALASGRGGVDQVRLAAALGRYWEMRGRLREGRDRLREVLAEAGDVPPLLRARAENAAALLAQRQGDYAAARSRLEHSLNLRRQAGDPLGVAVALHGLGNVAALQHDPVEARRLYELSLAMGRELGEATLVAAALDNLGWLAHANGNFAGARAFYEEALAHRREAGDQHGIARLLGHLGDLAYQQGDYDAASALHRESLELRARSGDRAGQADSLATLGHLAMHDAEGDFSRARELLAESLAIRRQLGDRAALPGALANLADLALLTGAVEDARGYLKEAVSVAADGRDQRALAHVLAHHGRLALAEGRPELALRRYAEAREAGGVPGRDTVAAEWLEGASGALAAAGEPRLAARLLGAAAALRRALGTPVPPYERPAHEREVAAVRSALDEPAFASAYEEGLNLPFPEAVEQASDALARATGGPATGHEA